MNRRAFMTDPTVSKMGLPMDFGLLMLDWVMMDMVDLEMMSWIEQVIRRTRVMGAQGIVQLSWMKCLAQCRSRSECDRKGVNFRLHCEDCRVWHAAHSQHNWDFKWVGIPHPTYVDWRRSHEHANWVLFDPSSKAKGPKSQYHTTTQEIYVHDC